MYTNNDSNIVNDIRSHLEKGDSYFELYFAEQAMDNRRLSTIIEGFYGVSLPDNLKIKLDFSTSDMEDDIAKVLVDKLSNIDWPCNVSLSIKLRNNFLSNEAANVLLDFCKQFDKFPAANVLLDLDNNNDLTSGIIDDCLEKIENSKINGSSVTNEDHSRTIEFSRFLIQEYLSKDPESD